MKHFPHPSVAGLEPLEPRALFADVAIDMPTITSRGTLIVTGTGGDDRISITVRNNKLRVIVKTATSAVLLDQRYSFSTFKRLAVVSGDGNDLIQVSPAYTRSLAVDAGAGNDVVFEGAGAAVLDGGAGNDVLGRPGDDAFANPVTLLGGAGDDLLQPDLTDFADGGVGIDAIGRDTSARTIQTNGIESSSRFVAGVDSNGVLRVTGTDGDEEISIYARGPMNAEGTREVPTWAEVIAFNPSMLWKPLINVDLVDFGSVVLDGIGGNDELMVAYEIGKPTTINGGAGSDSLQCYIDGAVLNGGAGNDTLVAAAYHGLYHRGDRVVARSGEGTALGRVELLGGEGRDTLFGDVNDILDGGADIDTVNVPYVVVFKDGETPSTAEQFEAIRDGMLPQATVAARAYVGQYLTHYNIERVAAAVYTTNLRGFEQTEGLIPV